MSVPCTCETSQLLRLYGRVFSFGHIEIGDGSERCHVCGLRQIGRSYYVWAPGPRPVCSYEHGRVLREMKETESAPLASPLGPSASDAPLRPTAEG